MLPRRLTMKLDARRLRTLLGVFFLALAVPTGILIWQAYGQLKWEAFHQFRGQAEILTERIDDELRETLEAADARSFADYSFLNVEGDAFYNYVQRSPLSAFPVPQDLPGVVGYFQVDSNGGFGTPLLPPANADTAALGIPPDELAERGDLARHIQDVLAANRLVRAAGAGEAAGRLDDEAARAEAIEEIVVTGARIERDDRDNVPASPPDTEIGTSRLEGRVAEPDPLDLEAELMNQVESRGTAAESSARDLLSDLSEERDGEAVGADSFGQEVFDRLRQSAAAPASSATEYNQLAVIPQLANAPQPGGIREQEAAVARVSELKLDQDLQQKSEDAEQDGKLQSGPAMEVAAPAREKRREQTALPEAPSPADEDASTAVVGFGDLRISTFESEVDPLAFSSLGSGHFVLFRNVWRNGERFVQGLLMERETFLAGVLEPAFRGSTLSSMSSLIVGYRDEVISVYPPSGIGSYTDSAMQGDLLYSGHLSSPLDGLELVFSLSSLPPPAGAGVLGWVTLSIAAVFVGGFIAIYRLGMSQLQLARQQQDFVSAVSHELKTPLTSIRMYGEMLKEGWADDAKRQEYYEFIHDESERLTRMISNVLQLSRITRNEPGFDLRETEVAALLDQVRSKIANQVKRAGFEFDIGTTDLDDARIRIDQDCFAQIVINLVDNAIKFSRDAERKRIDITCRRTGSDQVEIGVRDYGPGVPQDQLRKIFRLFYRSESELTRETAGTGIGLAIVHQLTLAMDGKVDVINRQPGAEFVVTFPAA